MGDFLFVPREGVEPPTPASSEADLDYIIPAPQIMKYGTRRFPRQPIATKVLRKG